MGSPLYFKLEMTQSRRKTFRQFDGDKLEGGDGTSIQFVAKGEHVDRKKSRNFAEEHRFWHGYFIDSDNQTTPESHEFTAALGAGHVPTGRAETLRLVPTTFIGNSRPLNKPVLTIAPGG